MALDKVVTDIIESAEGEASQLISEAEKERQAIMSDADAKISEMRKSKEKELENTLKRLRKREISSAELEAKKIVLNRKKELLNKTLEETLEDLSSMSSEKKVELYEKIVANSQDEISDPVVYCPVGESTLLEGMAGATSVKETDMEEGIILENSEGTLRLDYRFRNILESIWETELKEVSDILFG